MSRPSVLTYESRLMQLPKKSLVHQLAFSQGILESMLVPFLVVDCKYRLLYVNRAAVTLQHGSQEPESFLDQHISTLLGNCEHAVTLLQQCFSTNAWFEYAELHLDTLEGGSHAVQASISPVFGMDNELLGASMLLQPAQTPSSPNLLEISPGLGLLAHHELAQKPLVLMAREDGSLTSNDLTLERFLESMALNMEAFLPAGHKALMAECLQTGQRKSGLLHRVGGRIYSWSYNPLLALNTVQVSVSDVTACQNGPDGTQEERLHDPLTGLPNRALFMVLLAQAGKRAARAGSRNYAVLYVDLDRFKLINDSLGHDVGDALLRAVSQRILNVLRSCDTLARLSGDEFAILLDTVDDEAGAMHAAERILVALGKPFTIRSYELFTTATIGIVVDNGSGATPEELVRNADTAMFRAKAMGKGSCVIFDKNMHKSARKRLEIEMDLKRTLDRDEFHVYYQPIVNLRTLTLQGFEALVRWFHPVRGMVSPGDFIPLAEETGMIIHIGTSVLYESCRAMADWRAAYPAFRNLMLSVNLSVRQFNSPTLLDDIQQILAWSEFPPHLLKLEITESGIMENAETSLNLLHALKDMQICLSIDDFGTGYSSLSYLHRFPFDYLKIDQSFIKLMHQSDENRKIVKTIISLARDMEKQLIAEGIETREQLAALRTLGCEYGQGFLFARPLAPEDTETLLATGHTWASLLQEPEQQEDRFWSEDE